MSLVLRNSGEFPPGFGEFYHVLVIAFVVAFLGRILTPSLCPVEALLSEPREHWALSFLLGIANFPAIT